MLLQAGGSAADLLCLCCDGRHCAVLQLQHPQAASNQPRLVRLLLRLLRLPLPGMLLLLLAGEGRGL